MRLSLGIGLGIDQQPVNPFGPNIVTNSWFDTDLTGWIVNDSGTQTVEWQSGKLHIVSDGAAANVNQVLTTVIGRTYRATTTCDVTSGTAKILLGTSADVSSGNGPQELTVDFTATSTSTSVTPSRSGACDVTFDDVVVREVL